MTTRYTDRFTQQEVEPFALEALVRELLQHNNHVARIQARLRRHGTGCASSSTRHCVAEPVYSTRSLHAEVGSVERFSHGVSC